MPNKKKLMHFLGNEKARAKLLSGIVVALMLIAGITGIFISIPRMASADTTYQETFEDDTVGQNPSATWYTYSEVTPNGYSAVTTLQAHNGTNSYLFDHTGDGSGSRDAWLNFTTPIQCDYIEFWFYPNATNKNAPVFIRNSTGDFMMGIRLGSSQDVTDNTGIIANDGIAEEWVNTNLDFTTDAWHRCKIQFNWTTHYYRVSNDTQWSVWYRMGNTPSDDLVGAINFHASNPSGQDYHMFFDDIIVFSESGGGPTLPSPPSGATATAYTKFDISLSGLDGNSRITFPTAHTTDSSGDIVWSNATSYGTLVVNNAGIQQINLTWTKGTGATNTYIRYSTSDPGTWTLTTGTLLYNGTATSYNHQNLQANQAYYYALSVSYTHLTLPTICSV